MTVIVYRKQKIFGQEKVIPEYLPYGIIPTPQRQEIAKRLDDSIRKAVFDINKEYQRESKNLTNQMVKWQWLGNKLVMLFSKLHNLEKSDIENNSIWPAISQYLDINLIRGFDSKRSGTSKDHLRKVWLLATIPNTDWFSTWTGWDAFIDRDDSLVNDGRILATLKREFPNTMYKLGNDDYQKIARFLVEILSSRKGNAVNFNLFNDSEINESIAQVKQKFIQSKK